jgi:hypothetical protein
MTDREAEHVHADGVAGDPAADESSVAPHPGQSDDCAPRATAARDGCRTDRPGWAGGHLHGAVRPRRRATGRCRPPGRWC